MAIIQGKKDSSTHKQGISRLIQESEKVEFRIVDSEFLIRLILASRIDGKDVDVASRVLGKIRKIHEILVAKTHEVM